MTSERVTQANRRNARASTGPRTAKGKARSGKNALTHGLSAQKFDLYTTAEVERLADLIAGDFRVDPLVFESARAVAETQTHLQRVRAAKSKLIHGSAPAAEAQASAIEVTTPCLWTDLLMRLERLERYERRAFTRRKTAIRHFSELTSRVGAPSSDQAPE